MLKRSHAHALVENHAKVLKLSLCTKGTSPIRSTGTVLCYVWLTDCGQQAEL